MDGLPLSRTEREMLKAVFRLTSGGTGAHTGALADHLGLSPGTVTATVKRLAERTLVDHKPYKGVELTHAGKLLAVAAIRRHRIVERFLADYLGYAWHEADRLAATFEHDLPEEVEQRIFERLGRPTSCPHGFPIPEPATERIPETPALTELLVGDRGEVAVSGSTPEDILEYLRSIGIRPGIAIEVVARHPFDGPVVIRIAGHDEVLTIGERLAERIHVKDASRPVPSGPIQSDPAIPTRSGTRPGPNRIRKELSA